MADQLNLSLWLREFDAETALQHFEELLRVFPFSNLRPGIAGVKVHAVEFTEPTLVEQIYPDEVDIETVMALCRDFENPDCAYTVEGWWDLWRFDNSWELTPVRVTLTCFGPEFGNDMDDHLRLELGAETDFLPIPGAPESARKAQSNVASVVRLAQDVEQALPLKRRQLWAESGENFAERFDEALP